MPVTVGAAAACNVGAGLAVLDVLVVVSVPASWFADGAVAAIEVLGAALDAFVDATEAPDELDRVVGAATFDELVASPAVWDPVDPVSVRVALAGALVVGADEVVAGGVVS